MRTQVDTTQKRNKKKQSTKIDKDPMQSKHNPKKKQKRTINKSQVKILRKEDS
jgi:hypothetical protein